MKCRSCGAENAIHMKECGNCGMSLSALDTGPVTGEGRSQTIRHFSTKKATGGPPPSQFGAVRRSSKELYALLIVSSLISLAFAVVNLLLSYKSGEGFSAIAVIPALFAAILIAAVFLDRRRGSKRAQYIWESGDPLAPVAEARGTSFSVLLVIPLATIIVAILGAQLFGDMPLLVFVAVGLLLSTAFVIAIVRTRVMIQRDSILVGIPSSPMMLRLPFDKMSSIRLRGRVLKVVMTESINPFSSREFRYLILGSPKPLAAAIQTVGVIHGVDSSVENVEVDPELLKSCMSSIRNQEDEAPRGYGDRIAASNEPLESKTSLHPGIISHLLMFAGVSTLLFAFVLTIVNDAIVDSVGRHVVQLECCIMLEFIFGFLILAGALMAHRRRRYGLVRASAILAIISIGGFVSIILGIISFVLLKKSADEFED